jgi:hypothetical protein
MRIFLGDIHCCSSCSVPLPQVTALVTAVLKHYGSDAYRLGPWSPAHLAQLLSGLARLDLGPEALHHLGFKFDLDPRLGRWNPNLNPGVPPAVAGGLTPIEQLLRHTAARVINTSEIPVRG